MRRKSRKGKRGKTQGKQKMEGGHGGDPSRRRCSGSHMKNWSAYLLWPGLVVPLLSYAASPRRSSKSREQKSKHECQLPALARPRCKNLSSVLRGWTGLGPRTAHAVQIERPKRGEEKVRLVWDRRGVAAHRPRAIAGTPVLLCRVFQAGSKEIKCTDRGILVLPFFNSQEKMS